MKTLAFGLALANADSVRLFRKMLNAGMRSSRDDVKALFEHALTYNCTSDLPNLTGPLRLIFGAVDGRLHRYIQILKKWLPNKGVVHIPGASHQIPAKKYRELNQQIRDFVSELI